MQRIRTRRPRSGLNSQTSLTQTSRSEHGTARTLEAMRTQYKGLGCGNVQRQNLSAAREQSRASRRQTGMNSKMKQIVLGSLIFATLLARAAQPYDFRASPAYAQLSSAAREKLEQVRRDQLLLWGALDMYADEHDGEPPATLDALVPRYLAELPSDPFVGKPSTDEAKPGDYTSSKGGMGYRYRKGSPGNRAWIISSVGLPEFPYLGERNNGLYICKGTWLSGHNPAVSKSRR